MRRRWLGRTGSSPPTSARELAAILGAAAYGPQQHVAVCPQDHDRLFGRFLELVTDSAIEHDRES
jgi:hypothetical protein